MKTKRVLPRAVLAKSMLPPLVATFKNFLKSCNLCARLLFELAKANSLATAFWIALIALKNLPATTKYF